MVKLATGETVWTNSVFDVGTVGERNVRAVVSEMNHTMDRAIEKLLTQPSPVSTVAKGN
jgi:hypothetical protein